jgi:hypothetical protein
MARIKVKAGEDFSDEKIEKVISMLEHGETKKSCCDFLGMTYNTSRLNKIIEQYESKIENIAKQKKLLKGTAVSKEDRSYIVESYLNGDSLNEIANNIFRSITVIKNVLKRYNVPLREAGSSYFDPVFLLEDPVDDYKPGDIVFSARYITTAEIISQIKPGVYKIYLQGKNEKYAYQPYYELGDLRKIQEELNIKLQWLDSYEIKSLMAEAFKKARQRKGK